MCFVFLTGTGILYAQTKAKSPKTISKQTLRWSADPNVLEYKIEIQDAAGNIIQTITTEENALEISRPNGKYKYKITAYDLLGREATDSGWNKLEVLKANQPAIAMDQTLESLEEDGKTLELNVAIADVTAGSTVELVNPETGAVIAGSLIMDVSVEEAASEILSANRTHFENVPEGKWQLVVTNPSGLSSESEPFEVQDTMKEKRLAAEKSEQERLEKERLEAERIELERIAAELAAERAEQERIAAEETRLAAEKAERERLERAVAENPNKPASNLKFSDDKMLVASKLFEEEELNDHYYDALNIPSDEEIEAQRKAERRAKWLSYDRKFYITAGLGINTFLYDNDFFKKYFQNNITPSFVGRIDFLPLHKNKWRLGFEAIYSQTNYTNSNYYYNLKLDNYTLQGNLVYRYALGKKKMLWLSLKGGGGISLMQTNLIFKGNFKQRNNVSMTYAYPMAGGGLSFTLIPKQLITIEVGADYYNLFMDGYNTGIISPYIGGGIRF